MSSMPDYATSVKYPACGAGPGAPCITISGQQMPEAHAKRKESAMAAGKKSTDSPE